MFNKSDILTSIFHRNALRRTAQLPLLDVRQELQKAVEKHSGLEYENALKCILDEFEDRLSLKWVSRWQRRNETDRWPRGMWISMMIGKHVRAVAQRILRMHTGMMEFDGNHSVVRYGK